MADHEITDLTGIAKIADSKLAQQVYADGLQKGAKEAGKLLGEFTKTTRIVLQPIFTALQGASKRLNAWVEDAVHQVPPDRLIEANPALLRATVVAIGSEEDDSDMRDYYVQLLASMVDRERQSEVHRAFPQVLQELSPLDALLLQITPHGTEVSLPDGLETPFYRFDHGLVATWETWKENDVGLGRYRFFRQVVKVRPETIGKSFFVGKMGDHFGFVELVLPQEPLFRDKGLGWHNLERLRLVSRLDAKDDRGSLKYIFWNEPEPRQQIQSLLVAPQHLPTNTYYRTELGKSFARCCVPPYHGDRTWHPFQRQA